MSQEAQAREEAATDAREAPNVTQGDAAAIDSAAQPVIIAAAEELEGIDELDLHEHPDVYQRIHANLQGALSAIDDT